jgi:hypothetical protein
LCMNKLRLKVNLRKENYKACFWLYPSSGIYKIKSKISLIVLYSIHHRQNPFKST